MNFLPATHVIIHLQGTALWQSRWQVFKQKGLKAALAHTGPHFNWKYNQVAVALGSATVNIRVTDHSTDDAMVEYVYPLSTVGRIKIVS